MKYGLVDKTKLPKNLINTDSTRFPKSINGMGETAENIVNGLQQATMREDIYLTTLLGWKGILSQNNLFKPHRSWCSLCLSEQINLMGFNYEKLIWTLQPVKKCLKHQIELENNCPNCNRVLTVFCSQLRAGYCSSCFKWLGNRDYLYQKKEISRVIDENTIESEFGELIVKSALAKVNSEKKQFVQNLSYIIKQSAFGNINEFSHQVKIWHNNIRLLLKGKILPTWETLSNISSSIEIPISDILLAPQIYVSKKIPEYESALSDITQNIEQLSHFINPNDEKIKQVIEIYVFEYPPPSANEIARRIGYSSGKQLKSKYPDLYRIIVDKYTKYTENKKITLSNEDIMEVLSNACFEDPPPSLQSVFRRIGCHNTGYQYYDKFPSECLLIAQRYKRTVSPLFDIKKVEDTLIKALKKTPPPSLSKLAKRLKCKRESLNRLFPQLTSEIISRRNAFFLSEKEKNIEKLSNEIEEHTLLINKTNQAPLLRELHALYIFLTLRQGYISLEENLPPTEGNKMSE